MGQDLVQETKALDAMDLAGLKAKYTEVFGEEPVGRNKKVLADQIRRRLFQQDIERKRAERKQSAGTESVTERIAALTKMSLEELRTEFEKVLGKQSKSRNRTQLVKRIAEKLQQDAYSEKMAGGAKPTLTVPLVKKGRGSKAGGRSKNATRSKKAKTADEAPHTKSSPAVRDERLPTPGSVLERVYKGKTLRVTVTDDGFVYEDKPYRSLSAVAMDITGSKAINGYLWFRLGKYAKKDKDAK